MPRVTQNPSAMSAAGTPTKEPTVQVPPASEVMATAVEEAKDNVDAEAKSTTAASSAVAEANKTLLMK